MFRFHERGGTLKLLPISVHLHSLSGAVRRHCITIQRIEMQLKRPSQGAITTLQSATNSVGDTTIDGWISAKRPELW
jgi:hypothetical protein